jgi:hypothetical protein
MVILAAYTMFCRPPFKQWLVATALFLVTAAPWYLRSFLISGDPLHPVGGPVFGYFLWDAEDLEANKSEQAGHGLGMNVLHLPEQFLMIGAPVLFLVILITARITRRTPKYELVSLAIFWAYIVLWFLYFPVDRYVAPVICLGLLLSAKLMVSGFSFAMERLSLDKWLERRPSALVTTKYLPAFLAMCVLIPSIFASNQYAVWILDSWNSTLDKSRAGYVLVNYANSHIPEGTALVQLGFENAKYFYTQGPFEGDWFGRHRYRDFIIYKNGVAHLKSGLEVRNKMLELNREYVLVQNNRFIINEVDLAKYFQVMSRSFDGVLLKLR